MDTKLSECTSASRKRVGPPNSPPEFFGRQSSPEQASSDTMGWLRIAEAAVSPFSSAAEYRNGLNPRAWLAMRLRHAVEGVLVEVESADHGKDCAGIRIQRHQCCLRLRQLGKLQVAVLVGDDIDDIATLQYIRGLAHSRPNTVSRGTSRPGKTFPVDARRTLLAGVDRGAGVRDCGHDRRLQDIDGPEVAECVIQLFHGWARWKAPPTPARPR